MRLLLPDAAPPSFGHLEFRGLIFDLDNTLYTNSDYAAFQERILIERLGKELGQGSKEARARIAELRAERKASGLPPTSLGNLFAVLGVDMATSVRWREECIEPSDWLRPDTELQRAMLLLAAEFSIALVSNNPVLVVRKSLSALGITERFESIVGLDSTFKSKPDPEPFRLAARLLKLKVEDCLSIGDRMDVDITPALELGMPGVLVSGVEEVYQLPGLLKRKV